MRVLGRRTAMLGLAALVAAQGGCTRQSQPPAQPSATPPVAHECPQPVPTGVVYHQAQDRWEVLLAPPDAAPAELPQTLPLRTYTPNGVVEGFVPSFESFWREPDGIIKGLFPAAVQFEYGQWVVQHRGWAVKEQPLLDEGFYDTFFTRGRSTTRYEVRIEGHGMMIGISEQSRNRVA